MATQDLSRRTFDRRYNRRKVLGQVGRILTDEDITAIGDVTSDEIATDRIGIIGAEGTSNHGFRITDIVTTDGVIDFTIEAGDYWIGGHRATLHKDETYRLQPDWLQRPDSPVPGAARHDLVVLEVFGQPVEASEQQAMSDPGLGGVDTVSHLRLVARVRLVTDLAAGECHDLWEETIDRWEIAGHGTLNPDTHALEGNAVMTVGFDDAGGAMDLCAPDIDEGFLGAANRAIRVQMVSPTHFVWGFENGGRLMRATVDATGNELTLLNDPRDEAHWPSVGQTIEVLPWGILDFNYEKLASEVDGTHFTTVEVGYDPDAQTLTLTDALPADFNTAWQARSDAADLETTRFGERDDPAFVYVRVWDRGEDRTSPPTLAAGVDVTLGLTGIQVTHTGTTIRRGDAWVIAARPFAPDEVAPWELQIGAEAVERLRFLAPLAHLIWAADGSVEVIDCRTRFRPLTRLNDCVTLRVGDGTRSHGDYTRIQDAVDALPSAGGRVLVLPGDYDEHVVISERDDIRIEGCGDRTTVMPGTGDLAAPDDTPIFLIEGSSGITIQDMAIEAPAQLGVAVVNGPIPAAPATVAPVAAAPTPRQSSDITLKNLTISHFQRGGAWLAAVLGARVLDCRLIVDGTLDSVALAETTHRPSLYVQGENIRVFENTLTATDFGKPLAPALGGMTIGGGSRDVRVERNLIEGCYGNGITLGSTVDVPLSSLTDDIVLITMFTAVWGTVQNAGGFTISDDNCFGLDPNPPGRDPDPDADPDPLVPVPDGILEDIRIVDNDIRNMGGNGIGVKQYFNLEEFPFFITVEHLAIIGNRITEVLSGENVAYGPDLQLVAAWAGIALADLTHTEIRENKITDSARIHQLPATGIFALFAEDTEIVENTIADVGRRADEIDGDGPGPGGWRGGVVINQVRPSPRDFDVLSPDDGAMRSDGSSALVIHGNSIRAPQGRAITAFGLGPMHVTDNRLVSQSGSLSGWLLTAFNLRNFGSLSLAGLLLNALLIIITENRRPNATTSHLILSILGGDIVALGNLGISNEFYLQQFGLTDSLIDGEMELGFDAPGELMVGGDIQLNDNQIRLDGLDGQSSFGISAVALASLDNVMAQSNQISLDLDFDFMGINLMALGFTVHVTNNRLKEPLLNCFVSALTWGAMNTTSLNQATHCILAEGFNNPALRAVAGNTELIEAIASLFGFDNDRGLCERVRQGFREDFQNDIKAAGSFFAAPVTNG